jgi:cytoskeleton protein RodZ
MAGLGQYLSGLRQEHGFSIDEMARATRVAPRYLEALERDDLTALPAPVFTRGYIRAYCQALGVSADEALDRYLEGAPVAAAAPAAAAARPSDARRPRGTLLVSFALLVGFGLALFGVALYLQSGRPEVSRQAALPSATETSAPRPSASPPAPMTPPDPPTPSPAPPSAAVTPSPVVPPTATPPPAAPSPAPTAATPPAPAPAPTAPPPRPAPGGDPSRAATVVATAPPTLSPGSVVSPYRLVARASEATWLRVRTEDGRTSEETIPAGEVREWVSNRPFVLTVGNAAGVSLELNGQKLPPLGGRGTVIGNLVLPPPTP